MPEEQFSDDEETIRIASERSGARKMLEELAGKMRGQRVEGEREVSKNELYHITFQAGKSVILKEGIRPQAKSTYHGAFGQMIKEFGKIYAFSNFDDAVRWASRLQYDSGQPTAIVVFSGNPGEWERDTHFESAGSKGMWLKRKGSVKPGDILEVMDLTPEMTRAVVQTLGTNKELTRTHEIMEMREVEKTDICDEIIEIMNEPYKGQISVPNIRKRRSYETVGGYTLDIDIPKKARFFYHRSSYSIECTEPFRVEGTLTTYLEAIDKENMNNILNKLKQFTCKILDIHHWNTLSVKSSHVHFKCEIKSIEDLKDIMKFLRNY